jgi:hypothetical protein
MDGPLFFWSFVRFYGDAHPRGSFSVGHDPRVLAQGTRLYVADAHPAGVFLVRLASDARDRRRHPRRGTLIEVASTCPSKRADDVDRAVHLGCIRRREDAILSWSRVMEEVLHLTSPHPPTRARSDVILPRMSPGALLKCASAMVGMRYGVTLHNVYGVHGGYGRRISSVGTPARYDGD